MKPFLKALISPPWIYVILAFAVLISAWATLIHISLKYSPKAIEIQRPYAHP
jgi:hypothetical protein